jgi:ABC-type bacteriocin/lantibiotic exporter with double-glycine peptidase domain
VEEGVPVIAFVNAAYWHPQLSDNIPHAVVVVGVTRTRVYLHDPLYSHGPSPVDGADFRAAWLDMDLLYAVIEPPLQQGHYDVQPKGPNHV